MVDVKWHLKKYGFFIVLMVMVVITGNIVLGKRGSGKNTEEVWEPPVIMESMEEVKEEEPTEYSYIEFFSDQQKKDVVKQLGEQGLVSVTDDMNMENYQKMEDFYSAYISGMDAMVTVFNVQMEGNIGALTFVHRNGKIQSYYATAGWQKGGIPELKNFGLNDLEEMRLTEKGYFIYTNTVTIEHGNLREYYKVKPLSDECRELTRKYIYGLSFVNYNMPVTNWDASNVEEILMPRMLRIYIGYTQMNLFGQMAG